MSQQNHETSADASLIPEMARAIIASRDFCGDEQAAAIDAAGRKPTSAELVEAFRVANREWAGFQKAAGVTAPISHAERAEITRIMERAE